MGVLWVFQGYARWVQLLCSLCIITGAILHLDNILSNSQWCPEDKTNYDCIGESLTWGKKESNQFQDNNGKLFGWRDVFTLSPDDFFDNWSPFFGGLLLHFFVHLVMLVIGVSWLVWFKPVLYVLYYLFFGLQTMTLKKLKQILHVY